MACCTTISPLNSSQKRGASGTVFDVPRSAAKRRRPTTTALTSSLTNSISINSTVSASANTTMFTTASSILTSSNKRPVVVIEEAGDSLAARSPFAAAIPYMPLSFTSSSPGTSSMSTDSMSTENQFKSELMERIKVEARRMVKRKQINLSVNTNSLSINGSELSAASLSSSSAGDSSSPLAATSTPRNDLNNNTCSISASKLNDTIVSIMPVSLATASKAAVVSGKSDTVVKPILSHNDTPLFTMNQVNAICERLIREREQLVREEYDKILQQKLNEQYDAFVKFTHEQIQRKFESSQCTYVS